MKMLNKHSVFVLMLYAFCYAKCETTKDKKMIVFENSIRDAINSIRNQIMPSVNEFEANKLISKQCSSAIKQTFNSALRLKRWSIERKIQLKVLTASGRLPVSVFSGTLGELGSYDQCLEVTSGGYTDLGKTLPLITGKYCMAQLKLPLSLDIKPDNDSYLYEAMVYFRQFVSPSIYNAFCVPSLCTGREVQTILTDVLKPLNIEVEINDCDTANDEIVLSFSQKLMLFYISIICALILISMYIDHYYHTHPNFNDWPILSLVVKAFSPVRNVKRFFLDRDTPNAEQRVDILDSIRIIIIILLILIHTCMNGSMITPAGVYDYRFMHRLSRGFVFQIGVNGNLIMEILFLLSGCLIVMNGLRVFQKKKVSFILFAMHRWLRFTPLMLTAVAINVLLPLLGNGPYFKQFNQNEINNCDNKLYYNLLYLNNWFSCFKMCTISTWFLAADYQLYILSYFALVLLATKPNYGKLYVIAWIGIGIAIPTALTYFWDIPPPIVLLDSMPVDGELISNITYFGTHQHITAFFMGIGVGYIIVTNDKLNISDLTQNLITLILSSLIVSSLLSSYLFNGLQFELTKPIATLYSALIRFIISLGIGWIIIVTVRGNGGPNKMFIKFSKLNSKTLSKLCFATAMTHLYIVRFTITYSRQHNNIGSMYFNIMRFIANIVVSFFVGFLIHVTVEIPFNILFTRLINSFAVRKQKVTLSNDNSNVSDNLTKKDD